MLKVIRKQTRFEAFPLECVAASPSHHAAPQTGAAAPVGGTQPLLRHVQLRRPFYGLLSHSENPWITCYLNEPLARLLWLLTFLNDES